MKKLSTLCTYLFLCLSSALSQQSDSALKPNLKFGKPTKEELSMTTYAPDSSATAVCLLHQGKTYFTYNDSFKMTTEQVVRIKILDLQGASHANVSIPYYSPDTSDKEPDRIEKLEGASYNLENGKIVQTPLTDDLISDERVDKNVKVMKFSLPAVKAGTVIEYRYMISSKYIEISNWFMQKDIPVVYNEYDITLPLVYMFNIESRGNDLIQTEKKQTNMRAAIYTQGGAGSADMLSIKCDQFIFTCHDLPAIKEKEEFCWCPEDYKIQISFDMMGTNFPGEGFRPLSQKWTDIEKRLMNVEYEPFGQILATTTNPFREAVKQEFSSNMTTNQKIIYAFKVLRKNLAWDGTYRLYGKAPAKVIKEKSGSNADLNFILISILKDYGFKAYPIVMSRRSAGLLPINYPSIQKLNTFIVAVYDPENNKYIYLDSSMEVPTLNVLPLEFVVSQGYLLGVSEPEDKKWISLTQLTGNGIFINVNATIEGTQIKGKRKSTFSGQRALEYQQQKLREKESTNDHHPGCTLANLQYRNTSDDLTQIEEEADFTMQAGTSGDRLYINPMIFPQLDKNPFFQSKRALPVEFPYPYNFALASTLTIPEGYTVEEMPKSQVVRTDDGKLICRYMIEKNENKITLNYMFNIKSYIFSINEYKQLQDVWSKVIEKNKASIVLKKL